MESHENKRNVVNGWLAALGLLAWGLALGYVGYRVIRNVHVVGIVGWALVTGVWALCLFGFFTLQPNVAAVLTLFGKYKGTVASQGFHWANPLLVYKKVSLRAHNLNGERLKVNDLRGNPIEIGLVVVWRVTDTARAVFDVEDFKDYVTVQSEAALRHLAMSYSYDTFDDNAQSLRGSVDEVSEALQREVQNRVLRAGVLIEEARISHLAYAPEIAGAMLKRQQAEAIVAARTRMVDGAVGMVEMALEKLEEHKTIDLDPERKAAMVSNLLVVLCGDKDAHPVVNAGSLYT